MKNVTITLDEEGFSDGPELLLLRKIQVFPVWLERC
jgi:hypothetical protein